MPTHPTSDRLEAIGLTGMAQRFTNSVAPTPSSKATASKSDLDCWSIGRRQNVIPRNWPRGCGLLRFALLLAWKSSTCADRATSTPLSWPT